MSTAPDQTAMIPNGNYRPTPLCLALPRDRQLKCLSCSHLGLLFLDAHSYILSANDRAHAMLRAGDCVSNEDGVLSAPARYRLELARCIRSVLSYGHEYATMLMTLPPRHLPVSVVIRRYTDEKAAAIVIVSDPTLPCIPRPDILRALYGLTDAEIRVACGVAKGYDPNEIARMHKITVNTVRTHLKRLFQKTGVKRQAELILILLTIPSVTE